MAVKCFQNFEDAEENGVYLKKLGNILLIVLELCSIMEWKISWVNFKKYKLIYIIFFRMTGTLKTTSEVYAIFLQECQMDLFKHIT